MAKKRGFPPNLLQDLSKRSASNYLNLIRTSRNHRIALALGAGVSASAGLPSWNKLLKRICGSFFYHWEFRNQNRGQSLDWPPKEMSIAFAHEFFWSDEAKEIAESFSNGDALLVAQQVKNCVRDADWKWLLRRSLYDDEDGHPHDGRSSYLLDTLANTCRSCIGIGSVINYNYDDLFEKCLVRIGVQHKPIYVEPFFQKPTLLPIYHPHGFLPLGGGPAENHFVLAEADYHQHIAEPHSWSNLVQLHTFERYSCLFVGASMVDPAMRRMLRLAQTTHNNLHFAFLPVTTPQTDRNMMFDALFDRDAFGFGVSVIRYDASEKDGIHHKRLGELLELLPQCAADESLLWV